MYISNMFIKSSKIKQRLLIHSESKKGHYIWLHGASVGELLSASRLLQELLYKYPDIKFLVTSHTLTSKEVILKRFPTKVEHHYLPYDTTILVRKFLKKYNFKLIIWLEQDLFPITLKEINFCNIPLLLLNARMSDKSFLIWSKFRYIAKTLLSFFTMIFPSSYEDEYKIATLTKGNIKFIGNLKYTNVSLDCKTELDTKILQKQVQDKFIWTALSTHSGEEEAILNIHRRLNKNNCDVFTIIIPRHINRVEQIVKQFRDKYNVEPVLYSKITDYAPKNILLVDTVGYVDHFCVISSVVFIGKSLFKKKSGGHNILEPLSKGTPVVFGKYMDNFKSFREECLERNAGIEVSDEENLYNVLYDLYNNKSKLSQLRSNTKFVFKKSANILDNYMIEIANHLKA